MDHRPQLIAYADRLSGGDLGDLKNLLDGPLVGVFGGVHILPFFDPIDGADAGFDPVDHTRVDRRLGDWADVQAIGQRVPVMADLIVNHISADSPQFADYRRHGANSRFDGLFLSFDRVFSDGAREADLLAIYRPRPGLPFTAYTLDDGSRRLLWTTFTPKQLDIDVEHPAGRAYLLEILDTFQQHGIRMIRLDAAGYAVKKAGGSCFMMPESFAFIDEISAEAKVRGMEVLVEIHSYYRRQIEIARRVDRVYDFALPPLVLHALYRRTGQYLQHWLDIAPRNCVNVLDTHDGIGVVDIGPDRADPAGSPGLVPDAELEYLVETIHQRSHNQSRQATGAAASNLDLYQVNCSFYDALDRDDRAYLIARAIQCFAPGVPQIYYQGLLAGENDMALLGRSGVGRDINRHHYRPDEVVQALQRPVVRDLCRLLRFRSTHPAFAGDFTLLDGAPDSLHLRWARDEHWAALRVRFTDLSVDIQHSKAGGGNDHYELYKAVL